MFRPLWLRAHIRHADARSLVQFVLRTGYDAVVNHHEIRRGIYDVARTHCAEATRASENFFRGCHAHVVEYQERVRAVSSEPIALDVRAIFAGHFKGQT